MWTSNFGFHHVFQTLASAVRSSTPAVFEFACGCRAAEKLEAADAELAHTGRMGRFTAPFDKRSKDDQKLGKLTRDTGRLAVEQIKGISSQVPSVPSIRPAQCLSTRTGV